VPDDPYLARQLLTYFPDEMRERFAREIEHHPLRREIIATSLTNGIIDRGGSTFIVRLVEETGHSPADVAHAFAAAEAVYGLESVYASIDALDGKIDGQRQIGLYLSVQDLVRRQTAWFLRNGDFSRGLEPEIARFRAGVEALASHLADILPPDAEAKLREDEAGLREIGAPAETAKRLAALGPLVQALDAVLIADATSADIKDAACVLFQIREQFHLAALTEASEALGAGDYFDRLAVNGTLAAAAAAERAVARAVIGAGARARCFYDWREANREAVERVTRSIAGILEGGGLTLAKLTVAVAQLRDLAKV
jgi:glutamate dehydrogenase